MYVVLEDDLGRLVLRRSRLWHRMLARGLAGHFDRQLAAGIRPEARACLALRAAQLTSTRFRRELAASLQGLLAEAQPAASAPARAAVTRPRIPVCRARIRRSAPELAGLAESLTVAGPVPARGVAIVSQLLGDGLGPLYRPASQDDLPVRLARAASALAG